jgi:hypothetical protein
MNDDNKSSKRNGGERTYHPRKCDVLDFTIGSSTPNILVYAGKPTLLQILGWRILCFVPKGRWEGESSLVDS